jgi:hypothetical protein
MVGDAEREIEIGEVVARVHRQRTHSGARDHAIIVLREPQHPRAHRIPLLDGEHACLRSGDPRQF